MAYTLSNKCAKNLCKWTVLLQLIIKNVVTRFFWNTVYVCLNTICQVAAPALLSHLLSTQRLGRRRCALHCLLCFVSTER